jgi:hypothetical protein
VARLVLPLEGPAHREPIGLRDEDLGDHDGGQQTASQVDRLETIVDRLETIVGELDREAGFLEEIALEVPDVRVALDHQDERAHGSGLARHRPFL